jgi:predicted N-formylglutamate amidohydrolase
MGESKQPQDWPPPVEILQPDGASPFVLTCEHASNHIPAIYGGLGLPASERARHIGWDIGAAAVTRALCQRLDAIGFLGGYSRLLIDLNRPLEAESSIPQRSEATDIPGNRAISDDERQRRQRILFHPYHQAVAQHLDQRQRQARPTLIAAIHSFTPVFHGVSRPWHAGILFGRHRRYGEALIAALSGDRALVVAANQPYVIDRSEDYTVPVHGEDRQIPAVLVEIRQDLIADENGIAEWTDRLAAALQTVERLQSTLVE